MFRPLLQPPAPEPDSHRTAPRLTVRFAAAVRFRAAQRRAVVRLPSDSVPEFSHGVRGGNGGHYPAADESQTLGKNFTKLVWRTSYGKSAGDLSLWTGLAPINRQSPRAGR